MYQALYRKWRPSTFDEVYGQPHVTKTLRNELSTGRISHAYLFTGSRGTGKTSCAKILAKAVNCLNPVNGNPCNECEICRGINNGSVLDVIEIDAASNNSVENIRDLREEANFTPSTAKYRVYIIDEVHMLSTSAFNALLKTLEEPPAHVIFILATTEVHKLPSTILSRCQRFDFNRITPEEIIRRLSDIAKGENITLSEEAATLIANIADGGMRDAVSILDRCLSVSENIDENTVSDVTGIAGNSQMFEFSDCISKKDYSSALKLVENLYNGYCDVDRICARLAEHFRNLMVAFSVNNCENLIICSKSELRKYKDEAAKFRLSKILECIDILSQTSSVLRNSINKKIQFEAAVIKMCGSGSGIAAVSEDLENRVSALEKAIASLRNGEAVQSPEPPAPEKTPVKEQPAAPEPEEKPAPAPAAAPVKAEPALPPEPSVPSFPGLPDGEFIDWAEVLEKLMTFDLPLFGILSGSSASVVNGRIIIYTDNPTLTDFIESDNRTHYVELMRAIFTVTGKKPKIAVKYTGKNSSVNEKEENSPLSSLKNKIDKFNQGE
ncbi:MAG: DNA polymerase III subunit gamma/tau [Clostridia bacterium]|nr:DNA polymerase III subunit gamma/tau [Clostridia bacterium]